MKLTKIILSIVFISFLAISCGGGGDGDSGGSSNGQVSQQSMDEFVSFITDNVSGCTSQTVSSSVKAINISSMLASSIETYNRYQSLPAPVKSIIQAVGPQDFTDLICSSGSLSFTPSIDTDIMLTGMVSSNQCVIGSGVDAFVIDGLLSFSLEGVNFDSIDLSNLSNADLSQVVLSGLSASSTGINIQAGQESLTVTLNLSSSFTTSPTDELTGLNATIANLSLTDNILDEQFSLTNTTITATGLDTNIVQINSNGTYNDPSLGTFTFNTPVGLTFDDTVPNEETITGNIQVNGANNSDILVTINDNDDIIFQADADGNGITDFSDTVNCSGLSIDTSGLGI